MPGVIAFGSAVTRPDVFERCAEPGLRLAREADSETYAVESTGSIFSGYNRVLEAAAERDDLEALVLLHQDTEIVSTDFCDTVRRTMDQEDVGLAGCVGAIGVRSIAWWEGSITLASFLHRFHEHGGGDVEAFSWTWREAPPYARLGDVDTLDGFLLVLSPWVVRNVRFDESLGALHGYDIDYCLQVREAGKRVVTADFHAIHHHSLDAFSDPQEWIDAHVLVHEKWEGRMPGYGSTEQAGTPRERALRAEAERDAARASGYAGQMKAQAQLREAERALAITTDSLSWRLTAPLRALRRRS